MKIKGVVTVNGTVQSNQVTDEGVHYMLESIMQQNVFPLTNAFLLPSGVFTFASDLKRIGWSDVSNFLIPGCVVSTTTGYGMSVNVLTEDVHILNCDLSFSPEAGISSSSPTMSVYGACLVFKGNGTQSCWAPGYAPQPGQEWPTYQPSGTEQLLAIIEFDEPIERDGAEQTRINWQVQFDNR